jgi:hypothetical protein
LAIGADTISRDAPQAGYVLTWREDTDNLICLMIIRWERRRGKQEREREREEEETPKEKRRRDPKRDPILQGKDDISKKFSLFLHFLIEKFGHIKKK